MSAAPRLGIIIVGKLPNGRVEGLDLPDGESAEARIRSAADTGRYVEIIAATVFQRQIVGAS